MLNCITFFEDPMISGKIKELISKINEDVIVYSILNSEQLIPNKNKKEILITNDEGLESIQKHGHLNFEKIIIIGESQAMKSLNDGIIYIDKKYLITSLGPILDKLITKKFDHLEYLPLPIKRLNTFSIYPCELKIKISNTKYITATKANSKIESNIMQKLIYKKINFLYFNKAYYEQINKIIYHRDKNDLTAPASSIEINAIESLHNYVIDLGFDPKIIDLTKKLQSDIEHKFKHKYMKKLFQRFNEMEGSFLYNHSYLTSVIALSIGKKLTWMSPDNKEKIYLGSILHNLGYKNKDNAIYESLGKSEILKLEKDKRQEVLNHPISFAKHLAQVDNIHQDVIKIVKDHHAVNKEESYPRAISSAEVNLIFALFVLSQQFSLGLFKINFNEEKIPVLIEQIKEKFSSGNYKKLLPEFEQTLDEIFTQDQAA